MMIHFEGQHAAGKTHHTRALAVNLRQHSVRASAWQHRAPAATDPYGAALDFAAQRHLYVTSPLYPADEVRVTDRWVQSTEVVGWTVEGAVRNALWRLAAAERAILPKPVLVAVLDTTDAELDRRLKTRGEVTERDRACRAAYRNPAVIGPWGAVRVDTSGPAAEVETRLLAMALARLGKILDAIDLWHETRTTLDAHDWLGLTREGYAAALGTRWAGAGFDANGSEVAG